MFVFFFLFILCVFLFKQKTAYEMRISDWSSDVCSSDLFKPDLWVHPLAAATRGLEGLELAEIGLMKAAGAVGVATGRRWIASSGVMSRLFAYANAFDLPIIDRKSTRLNSSH